MKNLKSISEISPIEAPSRTDIKCGMTIAAQLVQRYGDSLQLDKLHGDDAERFALGCRGGEGVRGFDPAGRAFGRSFAQMEKSGDDGLDFSAIMKLINGSL